MTKKENKNNLYDKNILKYVTLYDEALTILSDSFDGFSSEDFEITTAEEYEEKRRKFKEVLMKMKSTYEKMKEVDNGQRELITSMKKYKDWDFIELKHPENYVTCLASIKDKKYMLKYSGVYMKGYIKEYGADAFTRSVEDMYNKIVDSFYKNNKFINTITPKTKIDEEDKIDLRLPESILDEENKNDELERSIETYYIEMGKDFSVEKACIGYVSPYAISVYTREYEFEEPHFTVTDRKTKSHPLAKVIIPDEKFKRGDDFDVRYKDRNFSFNSAFKKELTNWLLSKNEDENKITNLAAIRIAWNQQARQYENDD